MTNKLGRPTSMCVLSGAVVGASNWSSIDLYDQYQALQSGAGVFDASAMSYFHIQGNDASNILNMLTPRDVNRFKVGSANFVILTTHQGTVDDECIVLKISENEFLLSCGGCKPITYMHEAIKAFPDARVRKSSLVSFNIKGPKRFLAAELLLRQTQDEKCKIDNMSVASFRTMKLRNNKDGIIVKTKIGVEVWADISTVIELWQFMLTQRDVFTPCGWSVLNIYRMESKEINFMLYPLDLNSKTSLYDVGCAWMIDHKNDDYVGKAALERTPSLHKFSVVKLKSLSVNNDLKYGVRINLYSKSHQLIGYITSGAFSPAYKADIVYACLLVDYLVQPEFYVFLGGESIVFKKLINH